MHPSVEKLPHLLMHAWSSPALQILWGEGEYREEMDEMLVEQAALERAPPKSALQLLKDRDVCWQLVSISVIIFCNGLSGVSAVMMKAHF